MVDCHVIAKLFVPGGTGIDGQHVGIVSVLVLVRWGGGLAAGSRYAVKLRECQHKHSKNKIGVLLVGIPPSPGLPEASTPPLVCM